MSQDIVLLPVPQRLVHLGGTHGLKPGRFVWLAGDITSDLLRTGALVNEALATMGQAPELTAAVGRDADRVAVTVRVDPTQVPRPQGYHLTILPDQIHMTAHDAPGAFYAAMTLRQVARQAGSAGTLPCLRVEDWPDFPNRGVMLDVSRDKVPTMDTLFSLIDTLAEWKVNQFQLYTEHTFAYRDHQDVWERASPITGEEVMRLDAYCRERFIELVPNQNSFGHMERWLMHPRYAPLAEDPDSPMPRALNPLDPGSVQLVGELYDELLPHFSSRQFNVGCDEVILGQGRTRQASQEQGVERVYLDFLLKVHELVRRHGRTMQFWGDIVLHHPELISELPEDIIALEWGYDASHPFGEHGGTFARAGVPFYVCPGTSSWNTIAGGTDNARANILSAAENGLAQGAVGLLNTDWGDNGHWQHAPVSYLGYAYGAAVSWSARASMEIDLPKALDLHAFHDDAGVMGRVAYDLGNAYKVAGVTTRNSSILHHLLLRSPNSEELIAHVTEEGLERTEAYVDSVSARLSEARMDRPDSELVSAEFRNAADLLRHACHAGVARLRAVGQHIWDVPRQRLWTHHHRGQLPAHVAEETGRMPPETRSSLSAELQSILDEYRGLWLARNRPGGLDDSASRWKALLKAYRGA